MYVDEKRDLAERVINLTVTNRATDHLPKYLTVKMWEDHVRLHLKHFNVDQLKALIDFYETEMGKSISVSQKQMADEIRSSIKLVSY